MSMKHVTPAEATGLKQIREQNHDVALPLTPTLSP
jgi:hypothetical protein